MVKAGEESGNLSNALLEVGMNLNKSYTLTKKSQRRYDLSWGYFKCDGYNRDSVFAFVVPTLAKTFVELGVKLPATTRFIIGLGNFFSNYLIFALLSVLLLVSEDTCFLKQNLCKSILILLVIRILLLVI